MNQSSTNSTDFDFDQDNRNGKIARLPRPLRERINRALYDRCTAKHLAQELNKLPEVKAVLAQHFEGRPIITHNIYEWKNGGYRDWLRRQQVLEQKRELAADAKDLADTANNMGESTSVGYCTKENSGVPQPHSHQPKTTQVIAYEHTNTGRA